MTNRTASRAAHLGITRLVEPRAIHREAVSSLERGTNPEGLAQVVAEVVAASWPG